MIYSEPIDGMCPRCQVELRFVKAEYEQRFEFAPAYSICPNCDWKPGDTDVTACDMCGTITNELVDHEGDEYCTKCHHQETSAKHVRLVNEAALRVNFETKYAVHIYYTGSIHTLDVNLYDSKDIANHTVVASSSVKLCADYFDDVAALKAIYLTLVNIASTGKLPAKFKPYHLGEKIWKTPELMEAEVMSA